VPDTKMGKADGLSRRMDWKVGVEKDNDNQVFIKDCCVVATTHRNGTHSMLTSAKLTEGYLVVGIYKRTRQGALAVLLLYIYYYIVVRATTMCLPHVHPPCFYLMSYYSSTCVFLKVTMLPTCALTSYL